jgi:hypothetical protein
MFIHAVPDNRSKKDGYYCSLVESHRINGVSAHSMIRSFGFVPTERLPYLKAAFNDGEPDDILRKEMCRQEETRRKRLQAQDDEN